MPPGVPPSEPIEAFWDGHRIAGEAAGVGRPDAEAKIVARTEQIDQSDHRQAAQEGTQRDNPRDRENQGIRRDRRGDAGLVHRRQQGGRRRGGGLRLAPG